MTDSYNSTMANKVKQYQQVLGLQVTGIATSDFQALVFSADIPLPTATPAPTAETVVINGVAYRTLKRNMVGEDVRLFKQRLQELGISRKTPKSPTSTTARWSTRSSSTRTT